MDSLFAVAAVASAGGVATALQAHFMGLLDRAGGTLESVFITYFGGGLVIGLVFLFLRGGSLLPTAGAPWYAYGSGLLGLAIVGALSYSTPRLGLVAAFTIFVTAQFAMGALLDHFGWLGAPVKPLGIRRLGGLLLVLGGVWLIVRG
ncbi:MAG: DMT family transporter [Desulfobacterales bacterium]